MNLGAGMVDESPRVRAAAHQLLFDLDTPEALALLDGSDDLRLVPAGEFTMGEGNQAHPVFLEAYFIEKYPVTNETMPNLSPPAATRQKRTGPGKVGAGGGATAVPNRQSGRNVKIAPTIR